MSSSPVNWGVLEAADALARKTVSAVELAQALLARADQLNPRLNAFTWCDPEAVMAAAQSADDARAAGDPRPLLGVPIAVKDVLNVADQPCTAGSKILQGYVAPFDATVIARLRAAGCVFIARTNTDEFAMGGSTETSVYGPTRNPWEPARVPGGSSGGSAAAVAAQLAPAALATDSSGSIRQPAAFCGVTGFKPTYGRVSRYGSVALASSLDQVGPIARSVVDAALIYQTMAGQDPHDSTTAARPVGDVMAAVQGARDLQGLKLGVPAEFFMPELAPDLAQLVRAAVEQCQLLGAQIVDVSLPHTTYGMADYFVLSAAEASSNLARYDGVRYGFRAPSDGLDAMYNQTRGQGLGAEVKRRLLLGTHMLCRGAYEDYYRRAQKIRTLIRRDFDQAFTGCDAIIGPVTLTAAFPLDAQRAEPVAMYRGDSLTATANLAGVCALSVPCGFTAEKLPVGLQILAPAFQDELALCIGAAYQQATAWHRERPKLQGGPA